MANIYTVKKGDTLSGICEKYKGKYGYGSGYSETVKYMNKVAKINQIENVNRIVVGQKIDMDTKSTTSTKTTSTSSKPVIKAFGLQSNTDRTIYATWAWSLDHVDHYATRWSYATGDGIWFIGEKGSVTSKQSTYNAPSNATKVKFIVKPIAKKHKVNKKNVAYWTAEYSTEKQYNFSSNPPSTPPVPSIEIDKYTLTAKIDNYNDPLATSVFFEIIKDDATVFSRSGAVSINKGTASYKCNINAGSEYKARCRAYNAKSKEYSNWSDNCGNEGSVPETPSGITSIKALSKTVVQLEWSGVKTAETYDVQYTTEKYYFDSSNAVSSISVEASHAEVTGLEPGDQYWFRVRATNKNGSSGWTEPVTIIIGEKPAAPTTWSSTTTVITGEPLTLYWIHNSKDGSKQTHAELELNIGGTTQVINPPIEITPDDEQEKTSSYSVDTSQYVEGTKILWRVRTAGITNEYGEWSVQRTVDIYAPPTLAIKMTNSDGEEINSVKSFPFYISGLAGPNTQQPIGYHVDIVSNEQYETIDQIGNKKIINVGDSVYSKYFDTKEALLIELSAHNIDLENNITYTIKCTVSMNSGLSALAALDFTVYWDDKTVGPNAEIAYDENTLSASIRPYCEEQYEIIDENDKVTVVKNLIPNVTLSVYRREYDGRFVEIMTGIKNDKSTFTTDPHPALDYARYRIVAISEDTGAVSFYDAPGYPTGETAVIIQWNEEWSNFATDNPDEMEDKPWTGSLLRLPYNIDVSDSNEPDVEMIEYVGRKHPVSYYGTQLGSTSVWNVDIPKDDIETLYALRRLAIWMGDVYVREPSGSGYWANIKVSYNQKHCALTIPVTLSITRVEGGM